MSPVYDDPTDVTDDQWELLHPLLPERTWRPGGPGRPPCDMRRLLNGILYLDKTGCQWRLVPKEFGHWSTIYSYFKRWRRDGVWAHVMAVLRQVERRYLGRQPEPSAGSMDSQSRIVKKPKRSFPQEVTDPPSSPLRLALQLAIAHTTDNVRIDGGGGQTHELEDIACLYHGVSGPRTPAA
jgi:transposase